MNSAMQLAGAESDVNDRKGDLVQAYKALGRAIENDGETDLIGCVDALKPFVIRLYQARNKLDATRIMLRTASVDMSM